MSQPETKKEPTTFLELAIMYFEEKCNKCPVKAKQNFKYCHVECPDAKLMNKVYDEDYKKCEHGFKRPCLTCRRVNPLKFANCWYKSTENIMRTELTPEGNIKIYGTTKKEIDTLIKVYQKGRIYCYGSGDHTEVYVEIILPHIEVNKE